MKNNKGFTFVEILAVIVIIGLLTGISIAAFSRYKENAIKSDYQALAKSSYNAMEEYMMSHPYDNTVSLETLESENLLSNRKDPGAKDTDCTGTVEVSKNSGSNGKLDDGTYKVNLCCVSIQKTYTYPGGTETNLTDRSKCDYVPEEPPTPPTPGTKYTLRYNDNGGSGCSSKSITKNPGEAWGSLCTPTRSGYKFNGWKNGGTTVTSSSIASGNITVVAQWTSTSTPTYTVTLNNNGATTAGTGSVKVKVGDTKLQSITNPKKVVTITYINKVGATISGGDTKKSYTLNGWYTASSGGSKVATNAGTPVLQKSVSGYTDASSKWIKKSNTTLYAQWAPVTATLPKVTKTGHTCKWTTVDGGKTVERASGGTWKFTSANSRTFTAVCTANNYTLRYNDNGGSGCSSKSITKPYNTAWGTLCTPTRSGYKFNGWKNGSTTITSTTKATGNITVVAQWTAIVPTYTVTLNNNGATTAGTGSVKVKVGDTKLPSITNPRKVVTITYTNNVGATVTGGDKTKAYTLNGWYTAASGGSKVATNAGTPVLQKSVSGYTDASSKWTKKSNTTLYAQWAPVIATLPKVTKTGHTCKWTTKDGSTTSERASGGTWTFSSANSRTFTAVCTANEYTLRYNDNGGSGCSSKFIKRSYNKAWGTLCTPTRSGHIFNGWKNGSTTITSSTPATGNITVVAQWFKTTTYTTTFIYLNGTSVWNNDSKDTVTVDCTTNLKSPTSCSIASDKVPKSNHMKCTTNPNPYYKSECKQCFNTLFDKTKWTTKKDGTGTVFDRTNITGNKTYYFNLIPKSEYLKSNKFKVYAYSCTNDSADKHAVLRRRSTSGVWSYGADFKSGGKTYEHPTVQDKKYFTWDGTFIVGKETDKLGGQNMRGLHLRGVGSTCVGNRKGNTYSGLTCPTTHYYARAEQFKW